MSKLQAPERFMETPIVAARYPILESEISVTCLPPSEHHSPPSHRWLISYRVWMSLRKLFLKYSATASITSPTNSINIPMPMKNHPHIPVTSVILRSDTLIKAVTVLSGVLKTTPIQIDEEIKDIYDNPTSSTPVMMIGKTDHTSEISTAVAMANGFLASAATNTRFINFEKGKEMIWFMFGVGDCGVSTRYKQMVE